MDSKRLAHYEVLGLIGKGGMGEVYRARDTKLDREVALKVLPAETSRDPERVARFEREARTLATLQHPNIASVYGFEETPEARFLVLELVGGEDLAERLQRGALPVDEVVELTRQLTEGLEAAHERNIVHRDLKPANIKVGPDGVLKILDFGLARAYSGDLESGDDLAHSPTITAAMTQAGTILGTAAYMSPEQAKGKPVDKRSDIWALGAIVFEMLTGRRLFEAETVSETIASVLLTDIDWDALPAQTPGSLRALMERCLQKDPKLRLRDVGEARIALADPDATISMRAMADQQGATVRAHRTWPWRLAVVLALLAGVAVGSMLRNGPADDPLPPLTWEIPDATGKVITASLAVSPDGSRLVFAKRDSLGARKLWVRNLNETTARPLAGTDDGRFPFWSPDGQSIGYFANRVLMRCNLADAGTRQIASLNSEATGGAWNADGVILIGNAAGPILRVSASGGLLTEVTTVDEEFEETHCWPQFLPDGNHFVFLADASNDEGHRMWIHSLDGKTSKIMLKNLRSGVVPDHEGALLWAEDDNLVARAFDFKRLEFTGPLETIQNDVRLGGIHHELAISISQTGIMALQLGSAEAMMMRVALDGSASELLFPPQDYRNPRISPDGTRLAFELLTGSDERLIYVHDLARGSRTLITPRGTLSDSPTWSPDGTTIYYGSDAKGRWEAYRKSVDGNSAPEWLGAPAGSRDLSVLDISSNGRWMLCGSATNTGMDLYLASLDTDSLEWHPWLSTPAHEQFARFSPDDRWVAFMSTTSGQQEIYVAPREGGPEMSQWMVSVDGGQDPAWSRDGKTLFYRNLSGTLMRVATREVGASIAFGPPEPLVALNPPGSGYIRNVYDLDPDGVSAIAFLETRASTPAIRMRTGWRNW